MFSFIWSRHHTPPVQFAPIFCPYAFEYIRDLTRYGVQFESYTEAHFRTTGLGGELMLAITAWIAEQERLRITERVNAGIARAKLHGTKSGSAIGRPQVIFDRARVVELRAAGRSWRQIASALSTSTRTVRRVYERVGVAKPYLNGTETSGVMTLVAGV